MRTIKAQGRKEDLKTETKMEHLQHQAMKYPDYRSQTQKA